MSCSQVLLLTMIVTTDAVGRSAAVRRPHGVPVVAACGRATDDRGFEHHLLSHAGRLRQRSAAGRRTEVGEHAPFAVRSTRRAGGPTVQDQPQAEHPALAGGHHGVQRSLHPDRIGLVGEPQTAGTAAGRGCRPGGPGGRRPRSAPRWPSCGRRRASVTRSAMAVGTTPPKRIDHRVAMPTRLRALARKNPVEWMIASTSSRSAAASASGSGNRAKSAGVVRLTRSSVHWADRMVAARSWKGPSWSSAHSSLAVPGKSLGQPLGRPPSSPGRGTGSGHDRQTTGSVRRMEGLDLGVATEPIR